MTYGSAPFGTTPFGALSGGLPMPPSELLADSLTFAELAEATIGNYMGIAVDTLAFGETVSGEFSVQIANLTEALSAQDTVTAQELVALLTRLGVGDVLLSSSTAIATLVETLRVADRLRLLFDVPVMDSVAFAGLVSGDPLVTAAFVDTMRLAGSAASSVSALAALAEALALRDVLTRVDVADLTIAADLNELLTAAAVAYADLLSTAAFSESVAGLAVVSVLVPDMFELGADPVAIALRLAGIEDGLEVAISFTFEDEPYFALSMNAASRATAEYTAFDFNSLAAYNGQVYAAGAAGLYRLGGNTDAGQPIAAMIRTAMQRVAQGNASRVSDAYLGFRGDGSLQLKVVVKDRRDNAQKGYVFDLVQSPAGAPMPGRFKLGKGLQSVYMAFELSNVAGADFAIDVLEIRPLVSYRKLP